MVNQRAWRMQLALEISLGNVWCKTVSKIICLEVSELTKSKQDRLQWCEARDSQWISSTTQFTFSCFDVELTWGGTVFKCTPAIAKSVTYTIYSTWFTVMYQQLATLSESILCLVLEGTLFSAIYTKSVTCTISEHTLFAMTGVLACFANGITTRIRAVKVLYQP